MSIEEENTVIDTAIADHGALSQVADERRMSILIYHRNGVQVVPLIEAQPIIIGRIPPADIPISDQSLSRQHARFELRDGEVWVEDLQSTNGTRVNGEKITTTRLKFDDEIALGSISVSLHVMTPLDGRLRGILSYDRFQTALEEECVRAKTFGRRLAMLMVRPAERQQITLGRWCSRIRSLLRPVDRLGLYGRDSIQILYPEAGLQEAQQLASAIVGGRQEGEPLLLCGVAIFPDAASSAEELIEVGRRAVLDASQHHPVNSVGHRDLLVSLDEAKVNVVDEKPVVNSRQMIEVFQTIKRIATSTIPVLINGETGSGKEVIARELHQRSNRTNKSMRCINCGAIPQPLIESVLFGHERGAFTGADRQNKGVFEEADGGTVLLDEIGELAMPAQVALLRVLETKRITRVGSSKEIPVDVRIVAATHRDLESMCESGTFRWDLLYRLNTMQVKIPPLRERPEDIQPLTEYFVKQANRTNGCQIRGITPKVMDILKAYSWPGNVRELRNVIERAVVIAHENVITIDDLSDRVRNETGLVTLPIEIEAPLVRNPGRNDAEEGSDGTGNKLLGGAAANKAVFESSDKHLSQDSREHDFKYLVQQYETRIICDALKKTSGNQTEASSLLDIPRRTLVYKIRAYEIEKIPVGDPMPFETTALTKATEKDDPNLGFKDRIDLFEMELIKLALNRCNGNQARAARYLGIPDRTLTNKARRFGLK